MRNWIIDTADELLPAWQEALPELRLLSREAVLQCDFGDTGILWFRLAPGESAAAVLPPAIAAARGKPLVVLSDAPDAAVVVAALAAGAAGCCNSQAAPDVLRQVALVVGNGGLWIGQSLLQQLMAGTTQALAQKLQPIGDDWSALLSEREGQVARLVAGGSSNKEIAQHLEITERTVKAHLTAIFEKLGVRDRLQLSLRVNGLNP